MIELMLLQQIMLRTPGKKNKIHISKLLPVDRLIQHSLVAMLEFYHQGKIKLEKIVQKDEP